MNKRRKPITTLGVEFKKTKSEKIFKEIYERVKPGVINYYSTFGKNHQLVEDAFEEAMISVWRDIDKLDVENFSISTNIYMKTRQHIIRDNIRTLRVCGESIDSMGESSEMAENILVNNHNSGNTIILGKHSKYQEYVNEVYCSSVEETFIVSEANQAFWDTVKKCKYFDVIYDHYFHGLKYKELCEKYNIDMQTVKNHIHHGKNQIKKILNIEYENIYKIFD